MLVQAQVRLGLNQANGNIFEPVDKVLTTLARKLMDGLIGLKFVTNEDKVVFKMDTRLLIGPHQYLSGDFIIKTKGGKLKCFSRNVLAIHTIE